MTGSERPLLMLDVDGPLNPYAAKPTRRPMGYLTYRMRVNTPAIASPDDWWRTRHRKPLRVWLNPDHGARLLALPYELVWATTWTHQANKWIAPPLGLPELPVIAWPEMHQTDPDGVHWKTRHLVASTAGRPFAWVDDEITERDRAWVAEHHSAPALLHWVDARKGLLDEDFTTLAEWARSVSNRQPRGDRW